MGAYLIGILQQHPDSCDGIQNDHGQQHESLLVFRGCCRTPQQRGQHHQPHCITHQDTNSDLLVPNSCVVESATELEASRKVWQLKDDLTHIITVIRIYGRSS